MREGRERREGGEEEGGGKEEEKKEREEKKKEVRVRGLEGVWVGEKEEVCKYKG